MCVANLANLDTFHSLFYLPELLTHFFAILNWLETSEGCQHPKEHAWLGMGSGSADLCSILGLTGNYSTWWSLLTEQSALSCSLGGSNPVRSNPDQAWEIIFSKWCVFAWEFYRHSILYKMFAHLWLLLCQRPVICHLPATGPYADYSASLSLIVRVCKMGWSFYPLGLFWEFKWDNVYEACMKTLESNCSSCLPPVKVAKCYEKYRIVFCL